MNIIVKRAILYYCDQFPLARTSLLTWYHEFSKLEFKNFNALKSVYGSASLAGKERVIFNIKGNDFRLIVSVNFRQKAAYIIWFGTHQQYNKINAETVKFNPRILTYKSSTK
ncbi:MAG: type II toxin-antitoxin system HigB family toxin [Saprospiraceae bacterium]